MASTARLTLGCAVLLAIVYYVSAGPTVGGLHEELKATDEVIKVVNSVHDQIEELAKEKYILLKPLTYRAQVVAGKNYFVKVAATKSNGEMTHLHLRIYKGFSGATQLSALKKGVKPEHALEYFQ